MTSIIERLIHAASPAIAIGAAFIFASLVASPAAAAQKFPEFPDPPLKQGRAIWLGTCEAGGGGLHGGTRKVSTYRGKS